MADCQAKEGHCCWIDGKECAYVKKDTDGRLWSCGLLLEHGNWGDVYTDQRYIDNILPFFEVFDIGTLKCGEWPTPGKTCGECGIIG